MKLLEYKGKELLSKYNIAIQKSVLVESPDNISLKLSDLTFPVVIKAQIMAGGRGKAGGIRFADNLKEAEEIIKSLLGFNIKGHIVKKLLIAQKVEGTSENYLSIILDRYYKSPMIIFSPIGGVDIEETARENPDKIIKIPVNPLFGIKDYIIRYIIKKACLPDVFFNGLQNIVTNIYRLFLEYDCILCEINPLLVTEDNDFIAIDAKIDIDDSSLYRHPDISEFRDQIEEDKLILEARKYDFLYIPIDSEGFVSVMSNGSGMLMSCIDFITKSSLIVGSALD
ncbi:MAG: succinate--CoA ligase subunit beta, partial [Actinobacteria bacterium]|nr:succinate--CoA ligase subunit beta [Actinomycetota bacterium]